MLPTSPFVRLELTQVRVCLFFFTSTLLIVFAYPLRNVKYPGPEMGKSTRRFNGYEWFKEVEIVRIGRGYIVTIIYL